MSILNNIFVNKDGFVFDSRSGNSYQTNEIGEIIIALLQNGKNDEEIATNIAKSHLVSYEDAIIDVLDFKNHLTIFGLIK